MVRAFAHGAMGRRIDPSCGEPMELFLLPYASLLPDISGSNSFSAASLSPISSSLYQSYLNIEHFHMSVKISICSVSLNYIRNYVRVLSIDTTSMHILMPYNRK